MKISIVTTTYNSVEFIERTMEAILSQCTEGFSIEYLLADDGSEDATISVIEDYAARHSNGQCVRVIDHGRHVGIVRNFFSAVEQAQGKYIAFCDADDIWQDPKKLLKQLTFMEHNSRCVLSYHRSRCIPAKGVKGSEVERKIYKSPHTSTLLIRNHCFQIPWPLVDRMTRMNDQLLRFLLRDKGDFCFADRIEPTARLVREESVFQSPRSERSRVESSLKNWEEIFRYFKDTEQSRLPEERVAGFQSRLNWLNFKHSASLKQFSLCVRHDLATGQFNKRFLNYIRYPLRLAVQAKRLFLE